MLVLDTGELLLLASGFAETCGFIESLRGRNLLAKHIQYPKIPKSLSESIVVHSIQRGLLLKQFGPFSDVRLGGNTADIIAATIEGLSIKIEVKASSEIDFATFGVKDYSADFLLWLRFGLSLRRNELGVIEVLVCPKPEQNLPWASKQRVNARDLVMNWQGDQTSLRQSLSLPSLLNVDG